MTRLLIITMLSIIRLHAQYGDSLRTAEVRQMFDKAESVWLKHYKGFDQTGNQYLLILGNDQRTEKGKLWLQNSTQQWQLEGAYAPKKCSFMITLGELDIWGQAHGERNDSTLVLAMISTDLAQSMNLRFRQIQRNQTSATPCPYNLRYFSLRDDSSEFLMQFQTFEDGAVQGYCIRRKDSITLAFSGHCKDPDCNRISMRMVSVNTWKKSSMEIILYDDGSAQITQASGKTYLKMDDQIDWEFSCRNFSNAARLVHARYPSIDVRSYQKWVQAFVQNWMTASAVKNSTPLDSNHNEKLNCAVSWQSNQFISGYFFWNEAGYRQPVMYPFNFNLRSGENMEIQDLFEKNADYKSVIRQYVDSCQTRLMAGMQREMKEHVRRQHFNYWNLLPTGICFFTEMSPVYGVYRILVPYSRLDPLLRKNGFIKKNM